MRVVTPRTSAKNGAWLSSVSKNPKCKLTLLTPNDEKATYHLARFIEVQDLDDSEVTA